MSVFDQIRRVFPGASSPAAPTARPADTKSSRVGPLISLNSVGRPQWTPRDYAGLAREGFARNAVVYRAVRLVAEAAAGVTVLAYRGAHELDAHPVLDLIAHPNPGQSGADLMEALYGHLMISGNAYLEQVMVDGAARELYVLRPDRMKVVVGPTGWPEAYDYGVGGPSVRFPIGLEPPHAILHLKLFHPLSDHYGLAPSEAAQVALDIHNAASGWAKALLDNSARPSGALVYQGRDGGHLSDDQFERLKKELEEGFQGARNAGRPLLLEGGLDWKSMGLSPKDMDFIEAKREAAREIALAFGIPPMLLGIPGDNTYSNYQEANRVFWRQTVLPLARRTLARLTQWLAPGFAEPFRLDLDEDRIEALAAEREALWKRVGAAEFLTEDEKRGAVGYGPT